MKNIIKITTGCFVLGLLALVSCKKETGREHSPEDTDYTNKSFVQVYNGIINSTRNYVYVDANQLTGAALAFNSTFPSTPSNVAIASGYKTFLVKDTLITSTQVPLSFAEVLQPKSYYTIFLYDSINNPKKKIVQNNIVIPSDTTARVRFANFIYSSTAVPNVDIYSLKRAANVFTNIPVTGVTDYIPYASSLTDTLYVRETGTMTQLAVLNGFNPTQLRSYTLVFRGRYQTTGTTGIARLLTAFSSN